MINLNDKLLTEADADELYLLLHIAKHMNAENFAWPSNATLCQATGWEIKKLQRVKGRCVEKSFFEVVTRYREKGGITSNGYRMLTTHLGVFTNLHGKGIPQNGIGEDGQRIPQNGIGGISQNGIGRIPQNGIGGHTPKRGIDRSIKKKEVLTNEVLTNDQEQHQAGPDAPDMVFISIDIEPLEAEPEAQVIYLDAQPEKEKKFAAKKEKGHRPGNPESLPFKMWEAWNTHHLRQFGTAATKDQKYFSHLKLLATKLAQKINEKAGRDFNAKVPDAEIVGAFNIMLTKILLGSDVFYKENFTPDIFNSKFLNIYQSITRKNSNNDPANTTGPDKWEIAFQRLNQH